MTPSTGGTITRTPAPHNPRIAPLDERVSIFEGTFVPEGGTPFVVETPLTGNGAADKQTVVNLARKRIPTGRLSLASTRIYTRSRGAPATFPVGATMGNLFGEQGSDSENGVEIGSCFFGGERCQIVLVNLRSRNSVTLNLKPPGGGRIAFSNQIAANTLAITLPSVVKEILGNDAREIQITLKEAK